MATCILPVLAMCRHAVRFGRPNRYPQQRRPVAIPEPLVRDYVSVPCSDTRMWRARVIRTVFVAPLILAGGNCQSPAHSAAAERQPTRGIYIPPNEQLPATAFPIYRKSNHEVYVSVGRERSFIGAALTRAPGTEDEVRALCDDLKSKGLPLGVVDTSDVPSAESRGASVAARYTMLFSQYAQDNTLFSQHSTSAPTGHELELLRVPSWSGPGARRERDSTLVRDRNKEDRCHPAVASSVE